MDFFRSNPVKTFGDTAVRLSRSPLGIIALFIVLVYGIAALVTAASSTLTAVERLPLVYFLVFFPVAVLGLFGWIAINRPGNLFSPQDSYLNRKSQPR
jgi:hypothetical protein